MFPPLALIILLLFSTFLPSLSAAAVPTTQTIMLIRHGEKRAHGLGQLDCQGLNRALALPPVVARVLGKPDAVFAPMPALKHDDGAPNYHLRPLATVEPTAIFNGLPVNLSFGLGHPGEVAAALEQPKYRGARTLIAWEHREIPVIARDLIAAAGGNPDVVPQWPDSDFDSIYLVRITRDGASTTARFEHLSEGLNDQPTTCPQ